MVKVFGVKRFEEKILSLDQAVRWREACKEKQQRVVFTNGCFDLLHRGHVAYLQEARLLGDALVVGLNDDASVRRLKGPGRPLMAQQDRACLLAALQMVDVVCMFPEDTPLALIQALQPDVLVKGGDYQLDQIVGRDVVEAYGGQVTTLPFLEGYSTTELVEKIVKQFFMLQKDAKK